MSKPAKDDDRITVFHVRNSNYAGGIETTLFGWFKYADKACFNVRLFLFNERRQLHKRSLEIFNKHNIECELLPWGYVRNLPGALFKLLKEVRAAKNPILHSHDTRSDLVALIVSVLTKTPLVISNHAWHPADFKRKVLEGIRAFLMKWADKIISVSEDTHLETLSKGLPKERCLALYSGIDLEPYANPPSREYAREYLGIAEDLFVVGNMARLWPEKEQSTIIRAAALLKDKCPGMRFLIIGDGPLEEDLRSLISELDLEDIVILPGFKEDFVASLVGLDCFAFPSSAEGTPMVIYSAMALGVPIIASPVSGVGEILEDQKSALLVKAADEHELAKALEKIWKDRVFAREIGLSAKLAAERKYSASGAVKKLEAIYQSLNNTNAELCGNKV